MTVTRLRQEMTQWEYTQWVGLSLLRKERADRQERRHRKGR